MPNPMSVKPIVEELGFYGAYHSNFENQLIHIVCVPMILWSALLLVGKLSASRLAPVLVVGTYGVYYISLDKQVGSLAALFYLAVWRNADALLRANNKRIYLYAALAQVVGWGVQVAVGHAYYEKRKPALFDSLVQAFSLAPLFVVYEAVWMLFPGFQSELKAQVLARVKEIQATLPPTTAL